VAALEILLLCMSCFGYDLACLPVTNSSSTCACLVIILRQTNMVPCPVHVVAAQAALKPIAPCAVLRSCILISRLNTHHCAGHVVKAQQEPSHRHVWLHLPTTQMADLTNNSNGRYLSGDFLSACLSATLAPD
jgi:hypothetical protein